MDMKWFNRLLKPAASLAICGGLIVFGGCNEEKTEVKKEEVRPAPSTTIQTPTSTTTSKSQETSFKPERRTGDTAPSTTQQSGTQSTDTQVSPPATGRDTSATPSTDQRSENVKGGEKQMGLARDNNEKAQETSYKADTVIETKAGGADEQAAQTVRMLDQPHRFEPAKLTVAEGQTVEWRNEGKEKHSATLDPQQAKKPDNVSMPEGAAPFDSGPIEPGSNFKHTFTKAGTYKYFCKAHENDGMLGEITVTPKAGTQQQ
jgi:plastocyanin